MIGAAICSDIVQPLRISTSYRLQTLSWNTVLCLSKGSWLRNNDHKATGCFACARLLRATRSADCAYTVCHQAYNMKEVIFYLFNRLELELRLGFLSVCSVDKIIRAYKIRSTKKLS